MLEYDENTETDEANGWHPGMYYLSRAGLPLLIMHSYKCKYSEEQLLQKEFIPDDGADIPRCFSIEERKFILDFLKRYPDIKGDARTKLFARESEFLLWLI